MSDPSSTYDAIDRLEDELTLYGLAGAHALEHLTDGCACQECTRIHRALDLARYRVVFTWLALHDDVQAAWLDGAPEDSRRAVERLLAITADVDGIDLIAERSEVRDQLERYERFDW